MTEKLSSKNYSPSRLGLSLADDLEATYLKDDLLERLKGHEAREGAAHQLLLAHTKFVQIAGINTAILGAMADRKEARQVLEAFYSGLKKRGYFSTDYEKSNFDPMIKAYEMLIWDSNNFGSPLTPALVGQKFAGAVEKEGSQALQKFGMAHFVERMRTVFQKLYILPHGFRLNLVSPSKDLK